jgi:hypothetical protein
MVFSPHGQKEFKCCLHASQCGRHRRLVRVKKVTGVVARIIVGLTFVVLMQSVHENVVAMCVITVYRIEFFV